jgi:KUP system potassium uptake protein
MATQLENSTLPNGTNALPQERSSLMLLALGAAGVVYGDIGTSPLYAIKEALKAASATGDLAEDVYGVLSMVFWAATIVVSVKYIFFLMRANNKGEGGILALMALAFQGQTADSGRRAIIGAAAVCGAALFYGDAILTPAISVLSAVEGLAVFDASLQRFVVPIALVLLSGLFAIQALGTRLIGMTAGPIMVVYFLTLGALGIWHIAGNPSVLASVNPLYAVAFVIEHPVIGFVTLGAVFLAVTGAEAVYADMGHFGSAAIRLAWFGLAFPCLILNYFGQGALVLARPETLSNPFFNLVPDWGQIPLTILAVLATIIASQAMITGAFSITRQAIQLGLLPRMHVTHTSASERGQIYIPAVNWALMLAVGLVVFNFKSSENLAHAYGISVSGTMVCTTILAYFVLRDVWKWSLAKTALVLAPLLALDLVFFIANSLKFMQGGWLPLIVGIAVAITIWTWRSGRKVLGEIRRDSTVPISGLVERLTQSQSMHRVSGTAVFMAAETDTAPAALLHNLKHNQVLHERNVIVTVATEDSPRILRASRLEEHGLGGNFWAITIHYGFMERPNVPAALARATLDGRPLDLAKTSFFLGRETLTPSVRPRMALWREWLFITLSRMSQSAPDYFRIPSDRVIEVGAKIEL